MAYLSVAVDIQVISTCTLQISTTKSFTAKFKLKQVEWNCGNEDNMLTARYYQECVCKWIAECISKSDELSK